MKETDVNKILGAIDFMDEGYQWTFYSRAFYPTIRCFILAVYMANDQVTQMSTRDVQADTTYIVARERCAIINDHRSSYWKIVDGVCRYVDLGEDIMRIFQGLQYAYLRAE